MQDILEAIAKKIAEGGRNIAFTGAGISTESGIPDFRSQGGIWDQYRPVYFDEFMSSRDARVRYWDQKIAMWDGLEKARPNAGHQALAKLYDMGLLEAIITQNIDGLHQESGIPGDKVIELHGNTRRVRCMTCGETSTVAEAKQRILGGDPAPECHCGGYLKPDTISFGQAMPQKEVEAAARLSSSCDFFLVVGSTLVVHPAAMMPEYARRAGAYLAIVNLSDTPYDNACQALVREKAGPVLQAIADLAEEYR
ncbi:SIR2 family NAD-dependent protein deacylase [Desulfatibacillum aliphaticivorans]|uniref:SIR2 family NAD-dependent protein deacylase n=1 Tax=Desulfatibacillum aliphaticivorans TaxID=218208 RepID=UPI00042A812A|nr:Sir2 family NAD-dependent protein deacetylase [Desulfatibacillum aliphaticivorans]